MARLWFTSVHFRGTLRYSAVCSKNSRSKYIYIRGLPKKSGSRRLWLGQVFGWLQYSQVLELLRGLWLRGWLNSNSEHKQQKLGRSYRLPSQCPRMVMRAILVAVQMSEQQQQQQQQQQHHQRRRCRQEMLAQSENRMRMIQCKLLAERKERQHNLKAIASKLEVELQFFLGRCMSTKRGNPEMGLGRCARKDAEGFAETMSLRKVSRKVYKLSL